MKRSRIDLLFVSVMICLLMTGCGGDNAKSEMPITSTYTTSASSNGGLADGAYEIKDEAAYEYTEEGIAGDAEYKTQNIDTMTLLEEKLVYHCDLNIETLNYIETIKAIKQSISKYNGVIQSENESDSGKDWYYSNYQKTRGTMNNYLKIRIPSNNYDAFLSELDGVGKITSKSTNIENISQAYYDNTTQIEALKIQEENLLAMLEKCETIEDMLTVQERLTQVQYELNRLQTDKRYMDVDVAYSYVNINITEVMEYKYETEPVRKNKFTDRLYNTLKSTGKGFLSFLEGLLFLIIRLSPYLIILGIICLIFRNSIKRIFINKKAKRGFNQIQNTSCIQQENSNTYGMLQNPNMMQTKMPPDTKNHDTDDK